MGKPARIGRLSSFAFGLLVLSTAALGDFPGSIGSDPWMTRPNDPSYEDAWHLYSHVPVTHRGSLSEWEREHGSGIAVDKAWQLHTGTPETLIAVLDSGINWDTSDLVDRHYLNRAELPLPEGSATYDANGDGRFSVSDYALDPRVRDANANGLVDAGDLIALFSDRIDQDQNGYVDDIAGWDFHEGDNDPSDRIRFGHGTGEAKDSVSALNNGIGQAGICGNCSFVALRVNDSFVVDANSFARAVVYAVDQGASLVQQALGSANYSAFTQRAIDYAYAKDVVIIGSAADENSYHHNFPSTLDPVIYTNSIRYDTNAVDDASTFVNFNNCSNFGARVDVATSGRSCSSEATANLSGVAGLAWSYAHSLGRRLSAGELISLIKTSASDISYGTDDPSRHATYDGWDSMTGYGRTNAWRMLDAIRRDEIPPEARIVTPAWFDVYANPRANDQIDVAVEAKSLRSGAQRLRLEVARGVETAGQDWVSVYESPVLDRAYSGTLASVPIATLLALPANPRDHAYEKHSFTIRLTVDNLKGQVAEARRTVFVYDDQKLAPGFPKKMHGSGESTGLFVDLNGDGKDEFATADGAGWVHAYTSDGAALAGSALPSGGPAGELTGFPQQVGASRYAMGDRDANAGVYAALAAGDLDRDGRTELVALSLEGHLSVYEPDGRVRRGFPVLLPFPDMTQARTDQVIAPGAFATPVLVDLDLDRRLDIVVPGLDGRLHVYRSDGKAYPGFPLELRANGRLAKLVSSPAVVDIDRDGYPDLVFGSNHTGDAAGYIFAVNGKGNQITRPIFPGFPTRVPLIRDVILPTVGTGVPTAPAVADLDQDGTPEIVVHAFAGKTYVFGLDGRIKQSLTLEVATRTRTDDQYMIPAFGHPAVGDLSGDGLLSPVTGGAGKRMLVAMALGGKKFDYDNMLAAWDPRTGLMRAGFPKVLEDMMLNVSPILVDLDGDGREDVVAGSGGYFLHAFTTNGEVAGFPHFTGGSIFGSASAGDFDGDGRLDIAATTREGFVYIWKTEATANPPSSRRGWLTMKGNPQRTGTR